ncbi:MAG: hypothetical protein ACRYFW_15360 [Janthinobacterium lividum]
MDDTAHRPQGADQRQHDGSTNAAGSIKQETMAAARQGKRQAGSLFEQAKDKVVTVASEQKDEIAERIEELAQSVHKAGEPFAGQQEWIADAIERGATELSGLASSLRDNDVGSIARQVKTVAQRQPALFAGICLIGGIALARIGKLVAADVSREDLPSLPEVGHGAQ